MLRRSPDASRAFEDHPPTTGKGATPEHEADVPTPEDRARHAVRSAARAVGWAVVQNGGYQVMALAVFVVLGRLLDPVDFGLAATAMVIVLFMRVVVDAGFSNALIQAKRITADHADTAFWTALTLGVAFMVLTIAGAPLLAMLFDEPRVTALVRVLSVIFVFVALDSTQTALLQREMQFRPQAIRRLIATAVSGAAAIILALAGAGVWALVLQQVALEGLTVALLWTLVAWRPRRRFSQGAFRELFAFGARYSGLRVLWRLTTNVDNLLIGIVLGPLALGYYTIAYRILQLTMELVVIPVNIVALPMFSRLQDDRPALISALYRAARTSAILAFPVYVGLLLVADPLLPLVFGAKWSSSVDVLRTLTLLGFVQAQLAFLPTFGLAVGRIRNELSVAFGIFVVQILAFVAVVHSGIVAVAAAGGVVMLVVLPFRLVLVRRWSGISIHSYFAGFVSVCASSVIMAAAVLGAGRLLAGSARGVVLTAEVATGVVVYIAAMALLAPGLVRELRDVAGGHGA